MEEEEEEEAKKERINKARHVMESRILSEEDFKKVTKAQEDKGKKYTGKRSRSQMESQEIERFLGDSASVHCLLCIYQYLMFYQCQLFQKRHATISIYSLVNKAS